MPYFVKRMSQTGVLLEHPVAYRRPSGAMRYACAAIGPGITDIWIEDETGACVADRARIELFHRKHGRGPPSSELIG